MNIDNKFRHYAIAGIYLYVAVTMLAVGYIAIIVCQTGINGLTRVLKAGPVSNASYVMLYVGITWLLLGSILVLLAHRVINGSNVFCFVGFYMYAFMYLNFLRERMIYGDVWQYVKAAFSFYFKSPLQFETGREYIYLPFWATCLQPFVPLGKEAMVLLCLLANYCSLLVFFFLLCKSLKRYGFLQNFSVLVVFTILCGNVPVIRTLFYGQVNLHVANLILISLLFYPKNIFLSASALSLAAHMKASPLVLILPFILKKDWKWLIYFGVVSTAVVLFTSLMNGFEYYIEFLSNVVVRKFSQAEFQFREYSIDSLVRVTFALLSLDLSKAAYLIWFFRTVLILVTLGILFKTIQRKVYYDADSRAEFVYNSYIVLLFFMLMFSPIIWEHHPVFIIFPFIVMLKKVVTIEDLLIYLSAYVLIFVIPTFDFYPFSYHRLVGIILCYVLLHRFLRTDASFTPPWFQKINKAMEFQVAWCD